MEIIADMNHFKTKINERFMSYDFIANNVDELSEAVDQKMLPLAKRIP